MSIIKNGQLIAGITPVDSTSITYNTNGVLQSSGNINKNTATGADAVKYDWVGTLSEYTTQQIETLHPDWICYITDDNTAEAYEAYSRIQSDSRYYQKTETYSQNETDALLNSKANCNADNFTQVGKNYLSGIGLPNFNRVEDITVLASAAEYIAPANGWFIANGRSINANSTAVILIENITNPNVIGLRTGTYAVGAQGRTVFAFMPVMKNDKISYIYGGYVDDSHLYFFYSDGYQNI